MLKYDIRFVRIWAVVVTGKKKPMKNLLKYRVNVADSMVLVAVGLAAVLFGSA